MADVLQVLLAARTDGTYRKVFRRRVTESALLILDDAREITLYLTGRETSPRTEEARSCRGVMWYPSATYPQPRTG